MQRTLELDPDFAVARSALGRVYVQKRTFDEAIAELQKASDLSGGNVGQSSLAQAYAVAGRKDDAQRILDELLNPPKEQYVAPVGIALIYAGLGEKDIGLRVARKGLRKSR